MANPYPLRISPGKKRQASLDALTSQLSRPGGAKQSGTGVGWSAELGHIVVCGENMTRPLFPLLFFAFDYCLDWDSIERQSLPSSVKIIGW